MLSVDNMLLIAVTPSAKNDGRLSTGPGAAEP
jgi:hypothetical protein